ncbi:MULTISPECIES: hypothetical protein [Asaia]|uniref:Uncharacterized protein n=1 Tax=Asaia bogorensis TaxID=91915 RepID=A0A060QEM7_9PROT|nr:MULTISPECIES: hypothetical protein [Asaia]ETD00091.1 hypothetical protein P792_00625 [Asaia sp. SF2.1]CDG39589.1 hypothetical protein ASAP_1544 [Asaia bogorensis]
MIIEPTAYHHKLLNDETALIVSERLTLSPRFPVHIGDSDNREGLSRETEPLVPLAKALDYAAALVAAERIKTANAFEEFVKHLARDWGRFLSGDGPVIMESIATRVEREAAAIREGGEHG